MALLPVKGLKSQLMKSEKHGSVYLVVLRVVNFSLISQR